MRFLSLFLLSLAVAASLSADSGSWGTRGYARRLATAGDLVFAADGRGLTSYRATAAGIQRVAVAESEDETLDAAVLPADHTVALLSRDGIDRYAYSDSGALQLRSTIPLGLSYTMLASGTTLLAGAGPGGVTIWEPTETGLATVGAIQVSGPVTALAFHGDHLYVAVKNQGVFSYAAGSSEAAGVLAVNAVDLAIDGDTLYIAAGVDGLVIADVSADASPRILNRLFSGEVNLNHIAVSDTRIYATEANEIVHVYEPAPVFGSSDDELLEVATIHEPVRAIAATGNLVFIAGSHADAFGLEHGSGAAVRMYDTSGASARLAGEVPDFEGPVSGVATNGTVAWVVDPPYLRVIDVSSPATPRELTSLRVEGLEDRIKVLGDRAIVYGRGDVQLFDVANLYKPVLLGVWHSFGRPPSNAAFAGNGGTIVEGNPWSGFHVVDFDHFGFTTPAQIAGIKGHYKEIVGRGSRAYIFSETTDLFVVDLGVRAEANVVYEFPANGEHAEAVAATSTHPELLLVSSPTLFRILTLADPAHPADLFSVPMTSAAIFGSSSTTAYLASEGVLTAIDLANGQAVTTSMTVRSPMQIAAADNGKVVVADRYGLRVFGPKTSAPPPPPAAIPSRRRAAGR